MFAKRRPFYSSLIFLISINFTQCDKIVEVSLNQGVLSGKVEKTYFKQQDYYAFKGIPYAEPPLGELRFQPPKPLDSWEGTQQAYNNKPTCLQFNSRSRNGEPIGISGSEDCLYLSVFTPNLEGEYPVVVFDYNDNFRTGFNGTKTYSPVFFIEEDVIVVTISHRLGLFGYLTTEDDVIPANIGIRDFILGLEWVKDNIQKFGGDPTKVTLMGNRGGAALIDILLYSEKAKGLFTRAILQSGTAFESFYFPENVRRVAFKLGAALDIKTNYSKTLLEELQKLDSKEILSKEQMTFKGLKKYARNTFPFSPIIEGDKENAVIKALPEEGKIVNDVPVLIGLTSREGLDIASYFIFEPRIFQDVLNSYSVHLPVRTNFWFDENSTIFNRDVIKEINELYYKDGYLHVDNILEYSIYIGDTIQSYAIDYAAKKLAKDLESPVYYYMFDFRGTINENCEYMARRARFSFGNHGATITDDLCYLHLCARIKKNYEVLKKLVTEQPEIKVLKKMVRLWTNFAKTSNPTPEKEDVILKGVTWQPMGKESKDAEYLHITKTLKMKKNPLGKRADFWDKFLEKYSKIAVKGIVTDEDRIDNIDAMLKEDNEPQDDILEVEDIQTQGESTSDDKSQVDTNNEPNWDDVVRIPDEL